MKAKANYYGGLSHLIGPAQLAGPGPPGALARCNLQAMRGGGAEGDGWAEKRAAGQIGEGGMGRGSCGPRGFGL